jgi:hypothetical protein
MRCVGAPSPLGVGDGFNRRYRRIVACCLRKHVLFPTPGRGGERSAFGAELETARFTRDRNRAPRSSTTWATRPHPLWGWGTDSTGDTAGSLAVVFANTFHSPPLEGAGHPASGEFGAELETARFTRDRNRAPRSSTVGSAVRTSLECGLRAWMVRTADSTISPKPDYFFGVGAPSPLGVGDGFDRPKPQDRCLLSSQTSSIPHPWKGRGTRRV